MKLIRSVLQAANAFKLRSSDHPQAFRTFSTLPSFGIQGKTETKIYSNQHSALGLNVCSPCNVGRRCFLHSGSPKEAEAGDNSRPMDYVRGLTEEHTRRSPSGAPVNNSRPMDFVRGLTEEYTRPSPSGAPVNNSRPMDFVRGLTEEYTRRSPSGAPVNNSRPMDFVRGLTEEYTKHFPSGAPLARYHMEQDADIVHIKVLRNNAFVTVTDSKGNKKFGASAGKLTGKGGKVARYAAESTAEHVGREARDRGLGSVVMKVNGFTYFKKKKQAILSFREGYTHSRGDRNPVVYIEDTTRKPHNGCRLSKKRRI